MKRVASSKRKFQFKHLMAWLLIVFIHYLVFSTITIILLSTKYLVSGGNFWPQNIQANIFVIYGLSIAPFVNALMHIIYDGIGSPWLRLIMWTHSIFLIISIPIILFTFL